MKHSPKQSARKNRQMAWRRSHDFDSSTCVPVDPSKLNAGNSWGRPLFVDDGYYKDKTFVCRDCGQACVWKAEDQKWWYEEMCGFIYTTAVRCRACRIKERDRKAEIRRMSEEGMARKRAWQAQNET
ncbi:MAG: zinc-ribbon domain-containing protein [Azoarcus sp.]|jgi:hypothetical protein|nr:zinc-ribbon domain-containing protein [Azoarcus sp.]